MFAAIWTFLNSPLGVTLIVSVLGKLFTTSVKNDNRRTQILSYADTAFQVVEALGPQFGLSSKDKYLKFVETIVDSLKAAGQEPLSGPEMAMLQQLASVKAMLAKPATGVIVSTPGPKSPLPLPPPPRG
jgi:hypothetical protein